jgi:glycine/D-amino acid oxidase-like deaminating enzyme
MKAIVIGAGIVGSAVAYRLAEAGAAVTIIEADRVGGGTSGISFAWTNANNKTPRPYYDLNVGGMKAHAALAEEFGEAPWYHASGSLEWCRGEEEQARQREKVERLKSWGYNVDYITKKELGEFEPDIDLDVVGDAPITFCPDEGWVDPVVYANFMVKGAQKRGAILKTGSKVVDIETRNGSASAVKTADGATYEGDMVVNCAGRWADTVAEDPSFRIPLSPTVGFIVFTPPVATSVARPIHSPDIHLRPDGAGRLMVRENAFDELVSLDTVPSPTMPQSVEVMRRAAELIPALRGVPAEAARITARPIPQDSFSTVGPVPRVKNYYVVVTHSGATLSPYLAKLAADEIVHGKHRPELDDFRPSRFFN